DLLRARVQSGELRIPRSGHEDLRIPLAPARNTTDGVHIGTLLDVPWLGAHDWRTMDDWPKPKQPAQHRSIVSVWDPIDPETKIAGGNLAADDALRAILDVTDKAKLREFDRGRPQPGDVTARMAEVQATLNDDFVKASYQTYLAMKPDELARDPDGAKFVPS